MQITQHLAPCSALRPREVRQVSVFGSTGSIGRNTVEILAANRNLFTTEALIANRDAEELARQARLLGASCAVVADESAYDRLKDALAGSGIEAAAGARAVFEAAARPVDLVMAAIVGVAGLAPTLTALRAGASIALANKECLVAGGALFMAEARRARCDLLPVDSEHSAIFQALADHDLSKLERIVLTASGGPFRAFTTQQMAAVTPQAALRHPNWDMGHKVTIDSATMMNKGLELIEAHHLFSLPGERIDILVHPESVVHGMVEFADGSMLAQLGAPDMRTPIAVALAWPQRMHAATDRLDLARLGSLNFEAPDTGRFPALALARAALDAGGSAPAVLNAANEIAVAAFLQGRIGFLEIAGVCEQVLDKSAAQGLADPDDVDCVLEVDALSRQLARDVIGG